VIRRTVAAIACALALALALPATASADPALHAVDGTASEEHVLTVLPTAKCDPAAGDPSDPKDTHFSCRYAIRGSYEDDGDERYLGSGLVNGRFQFDTRSFAQEGPDTGYGCFALEKGVVKFTTDAGERLRFRISRSNSRMCQDFDGLNVNGPDRTIKWVLSATPGGCTPPYCGVTGRLIWESSASYDGTAPPGIVRYLDTAAFAGTLTGP
jgi:hypothetical protein